MANSSSVYDWFQERLEIQDITDDVTSKYVPPHVNIFYCLGGITLVCFLIQFATGFAMTFYYKPTVTQAYSSVSYLMTDVSFGWLIRSVHRWSASTLSMNKILVEKTLIIKTVINIFNVKSLLKDEFIGLSVNTKYKNFK